MAVSLALQYVPPPLLEVYNEVRRLLTPQTQAQEELSKTAKLIIACYCGHKFIQVVRTSGNSNNAVLKTLHGILKGYLNTGNMIWSQFYVRKPWQYLWMGRDRSVIVNYGSYGCVPRTVIQHQVDLQVEMECFPDIYNRLTLKEKYEASRRVVAKYVGCNVENLVFVDNITDGINATLRCILKELRYGDIILRTSLTYAMVLKALDVYLKDFDGIETLSFDISFPILSEDLFCEAYEKMIKDNPRIKVAIFDHITSASAVVFPIERLGAICRKYNVMTIVDGAHAPGQVHLNLESYGVDIYIGNLHKWYYAPKSCAIMYIAPEYHELLQPSLVSHNCYLGLHDRFRRQGTKNYSAHISAGFACDYMESIGGIEHLHSYIPPLLDWVVDMYKREWNCDEVGMPDSMKAPYMRVVHLPLIFTKVYGPNNEDADRMIIDMINDHNICMFVNAVEGRLSTRVSAQIFSTKKEYVYVANVVKKLAKELEAKYQFNDQLKM